MAFDGVDLESLRLSQDFDSLIGIKKALLSIPLRKPHKHEFFRTHPEWSFPAAVLKMQGDRKDDLFVVMPAIVTAIPDDAVPTMFVATITRQDVFMLWPVRLPSADGRQDEWSRTALKAAAMAQTTWIRMAPKMALGAYEVFEAVGSFPEPTWPEQAWTNILQTALKDHVIEDLDHPALRRLRGEI